MKAQASYAGNLEEVKRLIENGVSANAADYDGRTGLVRPTILELFIYQFPNHISFCLWILMFSDGYST